MIEELEQKIIEIESEDTIIKATGIINAYPVLVASTADVLSRSQKLH